MTNRFANIYSMGQLSLAGSESSRAQLLENISAEIESVQDMSLNAAALVNRRDAFSVSERLVSGDIRYQCLDCKGRHYDLYYYVTENLERVVTSDSAASVITAGGNLNYVGVSFDNQQSVLSAAGNIDINVDTFISQGASQERVVRTRTFRNPNDSERSNVFYGLVREGGEVFNYNKYNSLYVHRYFDDSDRDGYVYYYSPAQQVTNRSNPNFNPAAGYGVPSRILGYTLVSSNEQSTNIGVAADAVIQAGGNVRVNAGSRLENGVTRENVTFADGQQQFVETSVGHNVNQPITFNSQLPPDLAQRAVDPIGLPSFSLPSGQNGLFSLNANIHHPYLIETNPSFADLGKFLSSDYMFGLLGIGTDQMQKRLGDGFYEQKLVRDAVISRTGQRFLAGINSDEEQFRYLMDNAIVSKESLNLSVGVALSAEQVAALTHDIVWLEEREVAGQKVLVPVLYLAQASGRLAPTGALIQGQDVALITGGQLTNQGTLRAQDLNLDAGNVSNSGLLEAAETLRIMATESIRNAQGGIIAGRDISAIALSGDVLNERTVSTNTGRWGGQQWQHDYVDSAARFEAANELEISAGRDVLNRGGVLSSVGDMALVAGRDVELSSVKTVQRQTRGSHYQDERITQHGSENRVGGDLSISADRDLSVIASRISSGGSLDMQAGSDLLISSAANESHFLSRSKKVTQSRDQVTQQSSEIQAGNDISLAAGKNLTVVASKVQAGNDVDIDAGEDVQILSAMDESASYYFKKKKGSFGRSSSKQQESYNSTNIASVIEAGNDLTINTSKTDGGGLSIDGGRDVTVIGSQLSAGNDLLVGATGDVAILSGVEEHGSYSKKTKSGFLGMSKSGKSQLKTSATQVASELDAGNDVVIAAGNDIRLRASTTEAGNDVELRSGLIKDTGDINLVSANDTAYSLTEQYRKKTGLSVSGGMLSVSSAKKAGQEARSSTSVGSYIAAERDASLLAERDINVIGSSVSAGRNLLLDAGRDVNVAAAQNQQGSTAWERERRTGIGLDSDRNGFTAFVGNDVQIEKGLNTRQTAAASSLEAGNDLDVKAGRDANLSGSDFSAGRDINVLAERDINLDAATERYFQEQQEIHQRNGLTVNVSHNFGNTVDAIKGIGQGENLVSQVSGVLKAADAVTQFVSGPTTANHLGTTRQQTTTTDGALSNRPTTMDAGRDVNLQAGNDINAKGSQIQAERDINMSGRDITLDVARGQQTSSTKQVISQNGINGGSTFNSARAGVGGSHGVHTEKGAQGTALATQIQAGRDIHLDASRDLELIGTRAEAGRDISLVAGNDIDIRAAQNDSEHEMRRKSGGGEVGVALGGQDFISVYASVDIGKGRLDREAGKQQEAYLYAGKQLSFESGRDTTVAGARLEGLDVVGKVGRDLLVSSLPDTGKVSGKELDASLTVSVGLYGSVSVSGSVGVGKTNGSTNWVENQTGIVARDRLDIRTENHTQLDGALLASDSGNLKLDTGTLGFRDIEGHDSEHAWYINAGGTYSWGGDGGSGGQPADGNAAATGAVVDPSQQNKDGSNNWNLSGYDYRKEREQIVRATVGEGDIVVRADEETGHDSTAGLNRDVSKAYEVTKDKEDRTDLYVSKSSVDAVSDPVVTLEQWKNGAENYGRNSVEAFTNLAALKEHARSAAEHDSLVAALAWAPELLVDAMDAMGTPTLGIFPGAANHGGLITQLPVLVAGDLQPLRVTGTFKTDKGKLVLEDGKPVLDSESLQVQQFAGFNEEEDRIFTNGIMNSMIEALANGLMQSGSANGDVSFVLAYNPTHGLIGDLIESAFDKNLQGAIRSGTARNLNGLFQQGIDAGPDTLHIYGHSQGGLLTWVAIKGLDFSNGESPTATLNTIQLSGAPVDAIQFHKDAETAGFGKGQSVFQVNRPDDTVFFGLLPKTDTVSDLPLFLGGNAQYSDDPVARTLGALFSVTSLFGEGSPHSNYACASCKPSAPGSADAQIRDIVIKPTLIDSQGDFRKLE
ncbi:hemagglutinin repeat-containing protein [Ectopseudomonas alcaliphila]|uniref:hemagglutinin repeat-containing protein n=1 Tax=Ectopseudomonas alcaliphila TaxID=101564 RepID=UPI001C3FB18C|nr:hemagglutinin repeat-containing protein [Pseudomonas alcaliphila]